MASRKPIAAILIFLLLVAACAPLPTEPVRSEDALQNAAARVTAISQEQQVAMDALNAQLVVARATNDEATRQAQMAVNAEGTRVSYEQQTVTAQEAATAAAVSATLTYFEMRAIEADLAIKEAGAEATQAAQERMIQNDDIMASNWAIQQQQLREEQALRLQRQRTLNNALPYAVGAVVFVVSTGLAFLFIGVFSLRTRGPLVVDPPKSSVVLIPAVNGEYRLLPSRASSTHDDDVAEEEVDYDNAPPADWQAFMNWRDDLRLPIGADVVTRQPILIDRTSKPHLLIAGSTGSGKSKTGIIPYVLANVGAGLQVILVNGRGADFVTLEEHPNITSLHASRADLPFMLMKLLETMVEEIDRRDPILRRYLADNWCDLPTHAGESAEVLLIVDEFLSIILEATNLSKKDEARMWKAMIKITGEARKNGIYLGVTMTDPTGHNLGKLGMTVRSQMARMVLAMNEEAASRTILGNPRDFPHGSAGIPKGQFIATVGGRAQHGVGFHPSHEDVRAYFASRPVPRKHLPDLLLDVQELPLLPDETEVEVEAEIAGGAGHGLSEDLIDQAELDAIVLGNVIHESHIKSLRTVGYYLYDRTPDQGISGQDMERRIKPALRYRVEHMNCQKSRAILGQSLI